MFKKSIALISLILLISISNKCLAKTARTYMNNLQRTIKSRWKPTKQNTDDKILAKFKLYRNGEIKDIQLVKPSTSPEANTAVLQAIHKSKDEIKSYEDVKEFAKENFIEIEFNFDYTLSSAKEVTKVKQDQAGSKRIELLEEIVTRTSGPIAWLAGFLKNLNVLVSILIIVWLIYSQTFFKRGDSKSTLNKLKSKADSTKKTDQNSPHYDPTNVKR